MNARIELELETAENVADAFDDVASELSAAVTLSARTTVLGTYVTITVGGKAYKGRGRGLVNAMARALEEVGAG